MDDFPRQTQATASADLSAALASAQSIPTRHPTELLICVKCRAGQTVRDDARRPGQHLFDTLAARDLGPGILLHAVDCLQNCDAGCTIALRGGDRWTYVFGNVDPAQADMIVDGAARYHATTDGLIPWRTRPEHFKRNCVARLPPPFTRPVTADVATQPAGAAPSQLEAKTSDPRTNSTPVAPDTPIAAPMPGETKDQSHD